MVSYTDYPNKTNGHAHAEQEATPRRPRFRLLTALAAPFTDVDERAIRRKGKDARNKIIGAPFASHAPAERVKLRIKPSPRGGD